MPACTGRRDRGCEGGHGESMHEGGGGGEAGREYAGEDDGGSAGGDVGS